MRTLLQASGEDEKPSRRANENNRDELCHETCWE